MRSLICIVIFSLLVSCEAQQGSGLMTQTEFSSIGEQVSYLGAGFDSSTQQVKSSECMRTTGQPIITDNSLDTATVQILADQSAESLNEFLFGSGKIGIPVYPLINVTLQADLTRDHTREKFSEVQTIAFRASGIEESLDLNQLAIGADAQRVLNRLQASALSDPDKAALFDKTCGDQYVLKVERGLIFLASIRLKYDGEYSMNQLSGTLSVELSNLAAPLKPLEKLAPPPKITISGMTSDRYEHVTVEVVVYQRGGTPEDTLKIFSGTAGPAESQRILSCNFDHREECYQAFINLKTYASQDLPKQLESRKNLAPLAYIGEQYYDPKIQAALHALPAKPDPMAVRNLLLTIRKAQADLDADYASVKETEIALPALYLEGIDTLQDKNLLQNLGINWVQNQILRHKISEAKDRISQLQTLYGEVEGECLRDLNLESCAADIEALAKRQSKGDLAYDKASIQLPPKIFSIYCQLYFKKDGLNEDQQRTVDAIIRDGYEDYKKFAEDFNNNNTIKKIGLFLSPEYWPNMSEDATALACTGMEYYLNQKKELTLVGKGLTDLEPIRGLEGIETIDLSNNSLDGSDVLQLALLPKLKSLNLTGNFITTLTPLLSLNAQVPAPVETEEDAPEAPAPKLLCSDRKLVLDRNAIVSLESLGNPNWSWDRVQLQRNRVASIPGIKLGACMKQLDLTRNPLKTLEVGFEFPKQDFELILKGSPGILCNNPALEGLKCTQ